MWDVRLDELLAFRSVHGHVNVPRTWSENRRLAHWVLNQRRQIRLGHLSPERLRRLEELGIRWTSASERGQRRDLAWDRMLQSLTDYRSTRGTCNVPGTTELGRWVVRQRHLFRRGLLREDRRDRLQAVGLDWPRERGRSKERDRAWERMADALEAYRNEHGDCRVPKRWNGNPRLARWVVHQRHLLRSRALREDRRSRLEALGILEPGAILPEREHPSPSGERDRAWRRRLDDLATFKKVHGHCNVPRRYPADPGLARWTSRQRELHQRGEMGEERARTLEVLGFEWSGAGALRQDREAAWERLFSLLVEYARTHGDCDVPARWSGNRALGRWVALQRTLRRSGMLPEDRVKRLDAVRFRWNPREARRSPAASLS